jgi:hypothetical protein
MKDIPSSRSVVKSSPAVCVSVGHVSLGSLDQVFDNVEISQFTCFQQGRL